jgi:hypothetical protein
MIWLTWRRLRTQAAMLYGAIAVLAGLLAATGPRLAHHRHGDLLAETHGVDTALYVTGVLALLATPFVIGMFWGAPLVARELDAGTHRLAWTQSRTRTRWLLAKLGVTGLAATAAAGLLSLAVTWWSGPIDHAIAATGNGTAPPPGLLVFPRLSPEIFGARGVAPLAYTAFAFLVGATAGTVIRRTLPAMAVVLAVCTVTQITMAVGVRPHLARPEHHTMTITATNIMRIDGRGNLTLAVDRPGAWGTAQHTIDATGRPAHPPAWLGHCPPPGVGDAAEECYDRLAREGYRQLVTYQPAGRFWTFQWEETAIYLALALLLSGVCTWWLRHRLS